MKTTRIKTSAVPAIALKGEKALKAAVAEVVAAHKRSGKFLAVWRDGKAVLASPDKPVMVVRESHAAYGATRGSGGTKKNGPGGVLKPARQRG